MYLKIHMDPKQPKIILKKKTNLEDSHFPISKHIRRLQ